MRILAGNGLLLLTLGVVVAASQTPPRDMPRASGTASVSGRVIAADTGAPQPGATVWLSAGRSGESPRATTDAHGQFRIADLAGGRYLVNVMPARDRSGYLGTGRRIGPPTGPVVDVRDGQALDDVTVKLAPAARITGRVVDDRGEPIARMLVNAMSARGVASARFAIAGLAQTDDRGEFRLTDLEPGDYLVRAMGIRGGPDGRAGATYLPTFHPGTVTSDDADVVTVAGGEERTGADIRLVPGRYWSIAGLLSGLDAQAARQTRVVATEIVGGYGAVSAPRPPAPDGSFRITGLTPGEYVVIAWTAGAGPGSVGAAADPVRIADLDSDIDNLQLTLSPGVSVAGHVVTASGKAPPFPSDRAVVAALPTGPGQGQPALRREGTVRPDWTFGLGGVHGPFVVRLASVPRPGWVLKAVRLDGRDVSNVPIDRSTTAAALELVIDTAGARIVGRVVDAGGRPAVHRPVLVFPAEPGARDVSSLRFRQTQSDEGGGYAVAALAPGDYLLVALDEAFPADTVADRRALDALVPLARRVTVKGDDTMTIDLKLGGEREE